MSSLSWVTNAVYDLWMPFRLIGMVTPLDIMAVYLKLEIKQRVAHLRYNCSRPFNRDGFCRT